MKSNSLAQLLATLGADQSFSRPHASDDNPCSEAQFRTFEYQSDHRGKFVGAFDAIAYFHALVGWRNDEHHHSGIALFTPAEVYLRQVDAVAERRQSALDAAHAAQAHRFPNGPPRAKLPPAKVSINPLTSSVLEVTDDSSASTVYPPERDGAQEVSRAAKRLTLRAHP